MIAVLAYALLAIAAPDMFLSAARKPAAVASSRAPQITRYETRGVIKSIAADRKTLSIAHEVIPNFMSAMTMGFDAKSAAQLGNLAVGDALQFAFVATEDNHYILERIDKR